MVIPQMGLHTLLEGNVFCSAEGKVEISTKKRSRRYGKDKDEKTEGRCGNAKQDVSNLLKNSVFFLCSVHFL